MSYDTVEQSVQDAAPCELYSFVAPAWTYYLTSCENDVVFGGQTYLATPSARSSLSVVSSSDQSDVTIELPASHALCVAYAPGIPVRELFATITRYHAASGVSLQLWSGYASGLSFRTTPTEPPTASFRVPCGTLDALDVDVPAVCAQRLCNNILYDGQCQVVRTSFQVAATISSIAANGMSFVASTIGANPDGWATHGEVLHNASTERRTITGQVGTGISLQCPFPNGSINVGDAVTIFAGCDHTINTCALKFTNGVNFGGDPYLPTSNLFYVGLVTTTYHT